MPSWTSWPDPGSCQKVKYKDVPVGARVLSLAPIGIRGEGRRGRLGVKPEGNCPRGEFSACYAHVRGAWVEIER